MKTLIQEVKNHVEEQFKINDYGNVVLVDDADETIRDMVMDAHCIAEHDIAILPSNFIYETLYKLLSEYDNASSIYDLYELTVEPDIYYQDLENWSKSNSVRSYYIDLANEQYSQINNPLEHFSILMFAQALEIEDIKSVLANYLENEIEHRLEDEVEV